MALGRCEVYYEKTGKPAAIVDIAGNRRTHPAWLGNPAWSKDAEHTILDAPGYRPYIRQWRGDQILFNMQHRARAGRIYDLPKPAFDDDFILVAPHLKDNASPNKRWPWDYWVRLMPMLPGRVVQIGRPGEQVLPGALFVETKDFRDAAAMIKRARLVICCEGGTHHMAASVGSKAVVLFGSFIPPEVTGYDGHCNISVATKHGFCGKFSSCADCEDAIRRITPECVMDGVREMLDET